MYTPLAISNELGRNRFIVFSRRLGREVRLYNSLQYDHWSTVETDLSVENYCERPKKIIVSVSGEIIETVFDMWIKTRTSEEFIFLSTSSENNIHDDRVKQKTVKELLAQQIWCKEEGKNHRVVTEFEVRKNQILLANKKILIPYYIPVNELKSELYSIIIDRVQNRKMSIKQLEEISGFHVITVRNQIYAMIYHGILKFNQNQEIISSRAEVTLNE